MNLEEGKAFLHKTTSPGCMFFPTSETKATWGVGDRIRTLTWAFLEQKPTGLLTA